MQRSWTQIKWFISSCTLYIVLFVVFFIISINISSVFFFHWYLKRKFIERAITECNSVEHIMRTIKQINIKTRA